MINRCLILAAATSMFLSLPATANNPFRFELTPTVGYRVGGSFEDSASGASVDLEDHATYGLIFNIVEKPNTQYEFGWSHQDTSVDLEDTNGNPTTLDIDIDFLQLGGTYLFDGQTARPYIVATVGAAHYRSDGASSESDTYFFFFTRRRLEIMADQTVRAAPGRAFLRNVDRQ